MSGSEVAELIARLALMLIVGAESASAGTVEPVRPGQQNSLKRAIFADGRLWLLSDAGELSMITEGSDKRNAESLPEPALDLCLQDGRITVVTGSRDGGAAWSIRQRVDNMWEAKASVRVTKDDLLGLSCGPKRLTLLTTRRLIDVGPGGQRVTKLSGDMRPWATASLHDTPEYLFVGMNAGEWGGGLRRVDRRSGDIDKIESRKSGGICGGPLNADCDPVNGIAAEPWKPSCVVLAIGLVHMFAHGRIVEVCGDAVRRMFFKPYGEEGEQQREGSDEPFSTVAFFGLAQVRNVLWAVGIDGLYRIDRSGVSAPIPLPEFREIGGINVSFTNRDFVLVLTTINERRSVSGATPLLVPR